MTAIDLPDKARQMEITLDWISSSIPATFAQNAEVLEAMDDIRTTAHRLAAAATDFIEDAQ